MTTERLHQLERTICKVADKFTSASEYTFFTDIHLRANQETGEFTAFDDEENEITRTIIENWINNTDEDFYANIQGPIREAIENKKQIIKNMSIIRPFSFILENDEKEHIAELYIVDDEIALLDKELLKGLDDELSEFLNNLLK